MTALTNLFLIVFGLIEFIFRFAILVILIATMIGLLVIAIDGPLALSKLITPYLWTLIKN